METGELLTRSTALAAVALYGLALVLRAAAAGCRGRLTAARLAWTAGVLALLFHTACAFHFHHGWSHAAAYADTARRTAQEVGWDSGAGLYANYGFGLVWAADAAWWWWRPAGYLSRPRTLEWAVQGYLGFITFNAAVVFGRGPARWLGLAVCLAVAAAGGWAAYRQARPARREPAGA